MNAASFVAAAAQLGIGVERDPPAPLDSPELWASVVELATQHRVAPLVGEALVRFPDLAAPAKVREALTAELFRSSATRLLCESAVVDVVRVLRSRGVDVLVLKGPTVAHTVYPRPELRIYHDVDVLCRIQDYPALYRALMGNGYTNAGTLEARGLHEQLARKPSVSESHSVRGFYHSSRDTKIEVHFDIFQLGLLDRHANDFWSESVSLDVDGTKIRCLAPEHQFLQLAVHAHRHGYSRLSWLLELDLMVRRGFHSLDWKLCIAWPAARASAACSGTRSQRRTTFWAHRSPGCPRQHSRSGVSRRVIERSGRSQRRANWTSTSAIVCSTSYRTTRARGTCSTGWC
jgi:hypothetical protein